MTERIHLVPSEGQSPESIQADIDRSRAYLSKLRSNGVFEYRSHYRWLGPVKMMLNKEVGPPPWSWPKVIGGVRRSPLSIHVKSGWRSTAYGVHVMWAPRRPAAGVSAHHVEQIREGDA